jgi:hypothetical protein
MLGERTAGPERDAERREVRRRHGARIDVHVVHPARRALELHLIGLPAGERYSIHEPRARNTGYAADGFDQS